MRQTTQTTTERSTRTKVESALLLNVVIRERAPVLELLPSEDKSLLIGGDTFFVLNLRLHVVDSVRRLDFERDGFAGKSLDEYLHASSEAKDWTKGKDNRDIQGNK